MGGVGREEKGEEGVRWVSRGGWGAVWLGFGFSPSPSPLRLKPPPSPLSLDAAYFPKIAVE